MISTNDHSPGVILAILPHSLLEWGTEAGWRAGREVDQIWLFVFILPNIYSTVNNRWWIDIDCSYSINISIVNCRCVKLNLHIWNTVMQYIKSLLFKHFHAHFADWQSVNGFKDENKRCDLWPPSRFGAHVTLVGAWNWSKKRPENRSQSTTRWKIWSRHMTGASNHAADPRSRDRHPFSQSTPKLISKSRWKSSNIVDQSSTPEWDQSHRLKSTKQKQKTNERGKSRPEGETTKEERMARNRKRQRRRPPASNPPKAKI